MSIANPAQKGFLKNSLITINVTTAIKTWPIHFRIKLSTPI